MTNAVSWKNSVSLCPVLFCSPRSNLSVTPGISWLPIFVFQSPVMNKIYFLVLVLRGFLGLHRTDQLHLLGIAGRGIDLDYCDVEWLALKMNRDHSVIFEVAHEYYILDSFVDNEGYSISSEVFLPTVVDIMVIWIKFAHSHPF